MTKRLLYLDVLRGMAIIAVVICHMQWLTHESEHVQAFTLFSTTTLIFAMGITKGMSLKKFLKTDSKSSFLGYTFKSMIHILMSYIFATIITDIVLYNQYDIKVWTDNILYFNALPPFYFIALYIKLSLWSPIIFLIFNKLLSIKSKVYIYIYIYNNRSFFNMDNRILVHTKM